MLLSVVHAKPTRKSILCLGRFAFNFKAPSSVNVNAGTGAEWGSLYSRLTGIKLPSLGAREFSLYPQMTLLNLNIPQLGNSL